jgi:TonB family protein
MKIPLVVWALTICAAVGMSALPAAGETLTLGGAALGEPVTALVTAFGPPGLVETTDQGQEWRWFDANGIDLDVLADDSLVVDQILVGRPEPIGGKTSPLVQPGAFPYLEASLPAAATGLRRAGAVQVAQPNAAVSVWKMSGNYVVLELRDGAVRKILALDSGAALRAGYTGSSQPFGSFRAPRLAHQYAVDYPRRAVEEHASGVVVVLANISPTGAVTSAKVIVSSGNADIDAAELTSIRRSTFHPAQCGGQPCSGVYLDREEYTLTP